jgi:hypothetical protein
MAYLRSGAQRALRTSVAACALAVQDRLGSRVARRSPPVEFTQAGLPMLGNHAVRWSAAFRLRARCCGAADCCGSATRVKALRRRVGALGSPLAMGFAGGRQRDGA